MSWRTAVTVLIVIFAAVILWTTLADPLVEIGNTVQDLDQSGQFNTDSRIDEWTAAFFDMFLILIFGLMGWGGWRVLRREVTRGRL